MKKILKAILASSFAFAVILSSGMVAHAAEGDITSIIATTAAGLKTDATAVITSAIGIGVVFFGAKLLWGKFKSMAR